MCEQGFHFCTDLQDVVKYYHQPTMRVFEIEATGIITDAEEGCSKRACSEIRLVKELSLDDVAHSITKSEIAYRWASGIGNKDTMINHITDSKWAYRWARWIGNQDTMINCISDSQYAFYWVMDIGNQDIMKPRVTEPYWIEEWNNRFPNDQII